MKILVYSIHVVLRGWMSSYVCVHVCAVVRYCVC